MGGDGEMDEEGKEDVVKRRWKRKWRVRRDGRQG